MDISRTIDPDRPVLIAGPTASGKSTLALAIARAQGGVIVNADALQVYANWRILSARPSPEEEAAQPHMLYGHVPPVADYSAGHWLREVEQVLRRAERPIIVGGTGLYFSALTEGLAEIPATPLALRLRADKLLKTEGLDRLLADLDGETRARIDRANPVRVQRAWEVLHATGRGLASWQETTPPALLPLSGCTSLLIEAAKDWLDVHIARRFDAMLKAGALDEVRANFATWDATRPASKIIGAQDLMAHLRGEIPLDQAREAVTTAARQYAKRQRTWFRARMKDWQHIAAETL